MTKELEDPGSLTYMRWFPYMFGACNITFSEIDKMDYYDLTYLKMATVKRNKITSNMYGFPAIE